MLKGRKIVNPSSVHPEEEPMLHTTLFITKLRTLYQFNPFCQQKVLIPQFVVYFFHGILENFLVIA